MNTVFGPALSYLRVTLAARYAKARSQDTELGASAVEWVIISAIVVAIIAVVGVWITDALKAKATQVCNGIDGTGVANTTTCS